MPYLIKPTDDSSEFLAHRSAGNKNASNLHLAAIVDIIGPFHTYRQTLKEMNSITTIVLLFNPLGSIATICIRVPHKAM